VPKLIEKPTRIEAAGNKPKLIDEYIGGVNSGDERLSIAHMRSPGGWLEPGQRPEFDRLEGRMGALQHTRSRGRRIRRHLSARIQSGDRPPR
jgi:hypothetical protein